MHCDNPRWLGFLAARHALLLCATLALGGCGGSARVTQNHSEVLRVHADQVVDPSGKPVSLRGVQFANWVFSNTVNPDPPSTYADQSDYQRAAAMGVNTIPFFFNWDQFEDDAAPGVYKLDAFDWLDENIAWARAAGIRLVLTLAFARGSDQTKCDGKSVWDVPAYQQRTLALWQAIATRYAAEPVIAGYDLLNAPLPSGLPEQWHTFAGQLVSGIREVDRQHILVVEPAVGSSCTGRATLLASDLFLVDDPNVLYAFAADIPWSYVAQHLPSQNLGDGGSYPDETQLGALDWSDNCATCELEWKHNSWDSTPPDTELALTPEETSWTKETFVYRVTNPEYQIGVPVLQSDNNLGTVYFDDFVVKEYDEHLNFVRIVLDVDIEDIGPWYLYQGFSDGTKCTNCKASPTLESDAHAGKSSISISGSTSQANASNSNLAFPVKLNYTYEMSGFLKGKNSQPQSSSHFRLDFWQYHKNGGVLPFRNEANLALYLQPFVAWGKAQRVPLYVNDFGTGRPTFMGDKGGLRWAQDMVDLLKANNLHFAYNEYHGADFGIYDGDQGLPDPTAVNQPLVDLLTSELSL